MHVLPAFDSYLSYEGQPALSVAIDEVYALRALCAHLAVSMTEDMELATLPASTRRRMEALLPLLTKGYLGESLYKDAAIPFKEAFRQVGVSDTLTEHEWSQNQGVPL